MQWQWRNQTHQTVSNLYVSRTRSKFPGRNSLHAVRALRKRDADTRRTAWKGINMTTHRKFAKLLSTAVMAGALAVGIAAATPAAHAGVFVSVAVAPPAIPVYEQPLCPGDGYIWTPGYWAYGDNGYYWVDGAWVLPPYVGALYTPGWWGYGGGGYFWNAGYWGPEVGYYGGINYGFGYFGVGYYGGYWNGGRFWYNRAYGRFGNGFRGSFYNASYRGYNGRPGGPAFNAHPPIQYNGHNSSSNGFAATRSSAINGRGGEGFSHGSNFAGENRGGFENHGGYENRGQAYTGATQSHGFAGGTQNHGYEVHNYASQGSSYAGASRSYSAPQSHSYAAPSGGGFSGGGHAGGGFSGGGSHGGGGGRR